MQRPIKFRAWDKLQGKMIQSVNYTLDMFGTSFYWIFGYEPVKHLRLSDFELMQYTGLKDKNGKEIYEGDIVQIQYWKDKPDMATGKIQWNIEDACFEIEWALGDTYGFSDMLDLSASLEVIGNIWENKGLLGDREK